MGQKNLFPGEDKHRGSSEWRKEVKQTRQIPDWEQKLLERVNGIVPSLTGNVRKVGSRIDEVQVQYDRPISAFYGFQNLDIAWVQLNVWEAFTKTAGVRTLRFSPDTASLMVLVRSPKEEGNEDYDWFLLARKKYQIGVGAHFVEFSRGWAQQGPKNNAGWNLFDRDFPGLRDPDLVEGLFHTQLGSEIWENTAEFINKTSKHLVLVTLKKPMQKLELEEFLVREKVKKEYKDREYPNLETLGKDDLMSRPMVFELEEAANLLNAHLTEEDPKIPYFGETFSLSCWSQFLATCGHKFPGLAPNTCKLPIP